MEIAVIKIIETLSAWKKEHDERFSYSFTIDDAESPIYRMSLYYRGKGCTISGAYSISTRNIDELLQKLQKGLSTL